MQLPQNIWHLLTYLKNRSSILASLLVGKLFFTQWIHVGMPLAFLRLLEHLTVSKMTSLKRSDQGHSHRDQHLEKILRNETN